MKWSAVFWIALGGILLLSLTQGIQVNPTTTDSFFYNSTDEMFYHENTRYQPTKIGAMVMWDINSNTHKGTTSFGYSTDGFPFTDASLFTWTWTTENHGNQIWLVGYNNYPSFPIVQRWKFEQGKSVKIETQMKNSLGIRLNNFKLWYLHSLTEGDTISYNDKEYTVLLNDTVFLNGDFNAILPEVEFDRFYIFKYQDLIDSGFDITSILIGDAGLINSDFSGIPFVGIGVQQSDRTFLPEEIITFDPTIVAGDGDSMATEKTPSKSLVRTSTDSCEIVYIDSADDIEFISRACKDSPQFQQTGTIDSGIWTDAGIVIDSTDTMYVYARNESSSNREFIMFNSTDGSSWNSMGIVFPNSGFAKPTQLSCAVDGNDVIHCCGKRRRAYYMNSSSGWEESNSMGNTAVRSCDPEVDTNNTIYLAVATTNNLFSGADGKVSIYTSQDGFATENIFVTYNGTSIITFRDLLSTMTIEGDNIFISHLNTTSTNVVKQLLTYGKTSNLTSSKSLVISALGDETGRQSDVGCNNIQCLIIWQNESDTPTYSTDSLRFTYVNLTDLSFYTTTRQSGAWGSIADTTFPISNRMTNFTNVVYTNWTGSGSTFNVVYERPDILQDDCIYAEGFMRDWVINKSCQLTSQAVNLSSYYLNITENGDLNITSNSNISINGLDLANKSEHEFLRLWNDGSFIEIFNN